MAGVLHRRDVHARKKGGLAIGPTRKGKGTKCMVVSDGRGVPLGTHLAPANPGEASLAEEVLRNVRLRCKGRGRPRSNPPRLVADKAYDSQKLRKKLKKRGIDLIAPHIRDGRRKTQDGRKLRRYKRRWIIERTNSWLNTWNKRLTTRWEKSLTVFNGFLHVAIIMICLRRL